MDKIYFFCSLYGKDFDPKPFLSLNQFNILEHHAIGDLGKKGTSKNLVLKTGHVRFTSQGENFDEFIRQLYSVKTLMIKSKVERKIVHLFLRYENQCNWEFKPKVLEMISQLKLTLTMSCDKIEPDMVEIANDD